MLIWFTAVPQTCCNVGGAFIAFMLHSHDPNCPRTANALTVSGFLAPCACLCLLDVVYFLDRRTGEWPKASTVCISN
jgi:hypothetical protein